MSRSLKLNWRGKAQSVVPSYKVWSLLHSWCLRKSQYLSFWQAQTLDRPKTCQISPLSTHQSRTTYITHDLLNVLATMQHLNYSRQESTQESKKHHLPFIFLTHLWSWNKVKDIKPVMKMWTPSKVIIIYSLKDLALTMSEKKAALKAVFFFLTFFLFFIFDWPIDFEQNLLMK